MISTFSFPTRILAGVGALGELPGELAALGVKRPLIVTDPGLLSTPAFALLREVLGGEPAIFSGVQPNPVQADVESALAAFEHAGCDGTIGFGGGSALDVAKIARPEAMPPFIAHPDDRRHRERSRAQLGDHLRRREAGDL